MTIVILYVDGESSDVAEIKDTVRNIQDALLQRKHIVKVVKVNKNNWNKAIQTPGQVYFNLVEDKGWVLYQNVARSLHKMGKAQLGHDVNRFSFEIDKQVMKNKLIKANISTPKFRIFSLGEKYLHHIRKLDYPLMVKPVGEHAGVGISQDSVVINEKEADERINYLFKNLRGRVLVEEFIDGREVTVTIIGNGDQALVLPVAELIFSGEYNNNWPIYTYNSKWDKSSWEYSNVKLVCPAEMSIKLKQEIKFMALKAFILFDIKDVVRIDMRIDDKNDKVYIVDINVSPSLSSDADEGTYVSAKAWGWSYEEMIENVVMAAYNRVYRV